MSTAHALRQPPTALPEWRRCGPFVLFAVLLHAAILLLGKPLHQAWQTTPPLNVTLIAKAPEPLPLAAPKQTPTPAAPQPAAQRERPHPRPSPVLAMTPEQQPIAAAPTTVAPVTPLAPVTETVAKATVPAVAPLVSAARFDAAYLQNPKPNYPALSRRLGEEGKVMLKVRVGSDGKPLAVDLEKSSNFERLDNAARQVVQGWRFIPAKRGEEAIEASVIVPIVFRLDT